MREKLTRERRSCIWVPSPQSIMNILSRSSTTCADALWRNVGSALPHPSICTLNDSKTLIVTIHRLALEGVDALMIFEI